MFVIGTVMNTHGIKGEIKVKQLTDFIERFTIGETIYYQQNNAYEPLIIKEVRQHKQALLIQFEGLELLDDVLFLKGKTLYIAKEQQAPLEEHAYYFHEIIDCTVKTTSGETLGVVDHILTPGANDVWVVKTSEKQEIYIPYIEQVVKKVNIPGKLITIEVMEGLLDK